MHFTVEPSQGGAYTWRLIAGNNQMIAWAGETFASHANARRAATAFKIGARSARYEIYQDTAAQWRWRVWRSSDKVAASGESFASRANAQVAANNVRIHAGGATGP